MSASLNRVMLIGNVGRDPDIRTTSNGSKVANLSLATSDRWKDKNTGEWREKTEWSSVVVWGDGLVSVVERFVRKGSRVLVSGKLQTRKWTDQSGQDRYSTEVVVQGPGSELLLMDSKPSGGDPMPEPELTGGGNAGLDDEIPFAPWRW